MNQSKEYQNLNSLCRDKIKFYNELRDKILYSVGILCMNLMFIIYVQLIFGVRSSGRCFVM
jgi:hypothetical protein